MPKLNPTHDPQAVRELEYIARQAQLDEGAEPKWHEILDANLPRGFRAELRHIPHDRYPLKITGPHDYDRTHPADVQGQYEALSTAWSAWGQRLARQAAS